MDEAVRVAIYDRFARTGVVGSLDDLARAVGIGRPSLDAAVERLAAARHLVLEEGRIVLAHPFASRNFGFVVMGESAIWWGGCAWDSFAIPHLLPHEPDVLVATRCPNCSSPLAWNVSRQSPPLGPGIAHFVIPMSQAWDDVIHTCENQRIYCSRGCVSEHTSRLRTVRGDTCELDTLWRLASSWYDGRLAHGYRRREPVEAREYFRSVGLPGEFWVGTDPRQRSEVVE